MKYVYHASKNQGLKIIEPRVSTHGKSWVYAMEKPEYALVFLGSHGDIVNQVGFEDEGPYIAERFENALEYAYANKSGSIYTLDSSNFKKGMTTFDPELVCEHSCEVLEERQIEDALEEILKIESEGRVKIYRYPNLPPWIPVDKSDLIDKAVEWSQKQGSTVLDLVKQFHPDILSLVTEKISKLKHKA